MARTSGTATPKRPAKADNGAITPQLLDDFRDEFVGNPAHRLAMNACSRGDVDEIALNRSVLAGMDWHFSHEVEGGAITHQRNAGFCWMYAALNWLRIDVMTKLKLETFEFSNNYMIFWDRFEKANRFLTAMVDLRGQSPDDRKVDYLLREPCPDGGEWHMVANLIRKYGMAPKSAMAETANLVDSKFLNKVVDAKLRQTAAKLFAAPEAEVQEIKRQAMGDVYRILCILMGEPPQRFDFSYRDKKKKFHAHRDLSPHTFYDQFVGVDVDDYVWVMSSPLDSTPYQQTFYIEQFQNVVEGAPGVFVNVEMPALKDLAVRVVKDKQALLFGCDVLQASSRKVGIMDPAVMDYELLFNTSFAMSRKERMQFLQARLTHNMVILGVDLVDDQPLKWKVENSWGDEPGNKGYFQMTDAWFDEHMYALVVHKKYLNAEQKRVLKQQPTVLPPWHALA
ncbi:MAG: peptidase C1-like family protein [Cyanobacteria bacterium RYN_339]|nr:peptidase C1-like family protein [Cyanobacteria bacterium RYN_339]